MNEGEGMRSRAFEAALGRGKQVEALVAHALGDVQPVERHLGDMTYRDTVIEVKSDDRAAETGRIAFELADHYPADGGLLWLTGVAKHATQPGDHLMVHFLGLGGECLLYDPVTMLRTIKRAVSRGALEPWRCRWWGNGTANGQGHTMGVIIDRDMAALSRNRPADVDRIGCRTSLGSLKERVDAWTDFSPKASLAQAYSAVRPVLERSGGEHAPAPVGVMLTWDREAKGRV